MAASGLKFVVAGLSNSRQQGTFDLLNMHIDRASAPAKDIHFRMGCPEIHLLAPQFIRTAFFEVTQLAQGPAVS